MATVNGVTTTEYAAPHETSSNLGKRKRILENADNLEHHPVLQDQSANLQNSLRSALDYLRTYDPSPSILRRTLPPKSSDRPDSKRTRLSVENLEAETIEKKILGGEYYSYEDVLADVDALTPSILDEQTNGTTHNGFVTQSTSKAKEIISAMQEFLTKASRRFSGILKQEVVEGNEQNAQTSSESESREAGQVLTVRTQTNTGPRQLFSGLQRSARLEVQGGDADVATFDVAAQIDLKRLPNGFDVIEPAPLDAHMKQKEEKQKRTFGDIFAPSRNAKPLEIPRSSTSLVRGNALEFIPATDASRAAPSVPVYKPDHVYSALPTGEWLRYNHDQAKVDGLFRAAYSSFAPSYDDSSAVISQRTRADLWWQRRSKRRLAASMSSEYPEDVLDNTTSVNMPDEGFEELVANFKFESTDPKEMVSSDSHPNDVDDVLQEISDLLQTLSSYQRARDLELSRSTSSTPSVSEFDTYEILRSQLSVLVNTLPPFAVAKLDGDQLKDLNISTSFVSDTNDYHGIGEPDDLELQRRRAKLAATNAAARTPAPVQTAARPTAYQASTANYTQRTPTYNSNTVPYARPSLTPYQTPRPPAPATQRPTYPQAQYGTASAYGQSTGLQQFQRPMPNGYSSYGSGAPQMTPYASQQKPMVNGHRPSVYGNSTPVASPTKMPALTPQQQMLQERQAQAIRMTSGNTTSSYTGYDGSSEKRSETPKTEIKAE